jgi:hypothetical protein
MLHILFSILISLGAFSATEVTHVDHLKKVDANKQEVILATPNEDYGGF